MNLSKKILTLMAATSVASMADVCTNVDGRYVCSINNRDDLLDLPLYVHSHDKQTYNVDLNVDIVLDENLLNENGTVNGTPTRWNPIGSTGKPFCGTFNGNGHTISGLYFDDAERDSVGFFGVVECGWTTSEPTEIKNLTIKDSYVKGGNSVGLFVGVLHENTKMGLYNVVSDGVVIGKDDVGGFIGYSRGNNISFTIENLTNKSDVTGTGDVGGFAAATNSNITATSFKNNGTISTTAGNAGGFVGTSLDGNVVINESSNSGDINGNIAGGFIGNVKAGNPSFDMSYNEGSISATERAGDFIGNGSAAAVTSSYNKGSVEGKNAGGFFGNGGTNGLSNSYNLGAVTGVEKAGGFSAFGWFRIENSYNAGVVTASERDDLVPDNWPSVTNTYCIGNGYGCIQKSEEEFTNGTVAGLLSSGSETVWTTGTDGYPVLIGVGGQENAPGEKEIVTLDGASGEPLVITEEREVDGIVLNRVFTPNSVATIMLPFTIAVEKVTNAKFYYFNKATRVDGRWKVTMSREKIQVLANTPYAVFVDGTEMQFEEGAKVTLVPNTPATNSVTKHSEDGNPDYWSFIGTYERVDIKEGNSTDGWNYCYAGEPQEEDGIKKGQFVYMGSGAWVAPMRAYLKRIPDATYEPAPRALMKPAAVSSINSIPFEIGVEFIDEEEGTMAIGTINTITGEIKADRWFDMKGRKLDHKPTTKGTYYNNRTKVIIK